MDVRSFLACLNAHSVRFVVIGAHAFPHHGYGRNTLDVDVLVDPSQSNLERTREALQAFGYDVTDISIEDLRTLKILIRDYALPVDIHPYAKGVDTAAVFSRSESTTIEGVPVLVPCYEDVVAMKRAAGRVKDLEDLRYLEAAHVALAGLSKEST